MIFIQKLHFYVNAKCFVLFAKMEIKQESHVTTSHAFLFFYFIQRGLMRFIQFLSRKFFLM